MNQFEKSFDNHVEQDLRVLHGPFNPSEVREGEGIFAKIQNVDLSNWIEASVWRLSPLGAELLIEDKDLDKININNKLINIELSIFKQKTLFSGILILTTHKIKKGTLVGIRWCHNDDKDEKKLINEEDRRQSKRFFCHENFLPTGMATNPAKFNDFIAFRILEISKDGVGFTTSLRNKTLVKGMLLKSQVSFPLVGNFPLDLRIVNCRIVEAKDSPDGQLWIGATIENNNKLITNAVADYLFQFGDDLSVSKLRTEGLKVKKASTGVEFSWVRTREDYIEVLELRGKAYGEAGKIHNLPEKKDIADIFDARARIITARYRGVLIGSLRLIFHENEDQLEHERFFNYNEYSFLPRKDEVVEVTRICTHPDFRGSDVLYALMKQMTLQVVQSGRRWVIGSAEDRLMPLYKNMGYKGKKIYFKHEDLNNIQHELLLGHIPSMLSGKNVSAPIWNELYKDVSEFISENELLEDDPFIHLRQNLYKALSPLTGLLTSKIRKKSRTS